MAVAAAPIAIGAAAGAIMNRKNPLQGALMGGLGGGVLGPAMGALGGMGGAGSAAASSAAPWASAAQGLASQEAGLGTLGTMGWGGATTGLQGALNGAPAGLLSSMNNPMVKAGMKMAMPQQQQPRPIMSAPMQQPTQPMQGSMTRFGMGQPMINGGRY
jgi:hypothetical protein